jgi:hypothetical protein
MNGSFGEDQAKERGETGVRICTETREDISQKERKKEKKKKTYVSDARASPRTWRRIVFSRSVRVFVELKRTTSQYPLGQDQRRS